MNRFGYGANRFAIRNDVSEIFEGVEERQNEIGTTVLWFLFDKETTANTGHSVYDESQGGSGSDWLEPFWLPVYAAIRTEGPQQMGDTGMYTTDAVRLVVSYRTAQRHGLVDFGLASDDRLNDRFVYDDVVFQVSDIQVRGQIQERDIVIGIQALEVDPNELINEPDFAQWAR